MKSKEKIITELQNKIDVCKKQIAVYNGIIAKEQLKQNHNKIKIARKNVLARICGELLKEYEGKIAKLQKI